MNYQQALSAYFQQKIDNAVNAIKKTPTIAQLDANREAVEARARITAPSVNTAGRVTSSVNEIPTYRPDNTMVETRTPYNGVDVFIPVDGDAEMFKAFVNNRAICTGFQQVGTGFKIKQYDFMREGNAVVASRIRACVEHIGQSLEELNPNVKGYHAQLASDLTAAVESRKRAIVAKEKLDKESDPWG